MKPGIKVDFVNPPIPLRCFDYSAVRDGYDEGDIIGWGATKDDAIENLLRQERDSFGDCDWCEKWLSKEFLQIEGFVFCDEKCEGEYYADRSHRIKNNLPPLFVERRNSVTQQPAGQE